MTTLVLDASYFLFCCCERTQWPRQLVEERVSLGLEFQREDPWSLQQEHGSRQAVMAREQELRVYTLILSMRPRKLPGNSVGFWNSKACPWWHTSSNKAKLPNPSQRVPLSRGTYWTLWAYGGSISFKPPHWKTPHCRWQCSLRDRDPDGDPEL